ncbi:Holliday junction resolvase RuvX [Demequina zhanjiangensis]|uniref:Putative pre-16S rRNA nuclease n=1 Tax=Demequina zhanjiangensis TaxID=3051659 RepID=A0ABT8G0W7_9MICO|nr:Holliday junction resolvase RuvX [Demequina sp. SYSU T00b26]MDN4472784.1 Holliday junction resolvase RuvX [Demequina sp. SYSU T00b26]
MSVDVGTVRVGVAASDPDGLMAFPIATVTRSPRAPREVADLIAEREATEVFVGLPRTLKGREGTSAQDARGFAAELAELTDATIRLIDERFSTASASRQMSAAGRSAKAQRQVIDQAAAVVILESALEVQKNGNLGTVTTEVTPTKGNDD